MKPNISVPEPTVNSPALPADPGSGDGGDPVYILDIPVSPWTPEGLIQAMVQQAGGGTSPLGEAPAIVLYANIHVMNEAYRNPHLREQLKSAGTVYCDGSGVRLGARILGASLPPRLTAADWLDALCEKAAREGIRLFLMGGADGVAANAADVLKERHSKLEIAGTHHGFLDPKSSRRAVDAMNGSGAALVLVGMGTPKQEAWIEEWRDEIEAPVIWAVGALLDFVAGVQRRAPRWMAENHLEWLWRFGTDPVRLGRRYVLGNPLFLARAMGQRLSSRRTHVETIDQGVEPRVRSDQE